MLLLISLCVMTLGVAVCVRSMLGSSVISTLPYVFETAGKQGLGVPKLTIGQYTYIMNGVLVLGQILVQAEVTGIDIVNAIYNKV
ncbi:DUF6198 family protein [Segatella copri]|uniref:DUF6198 family protein n=1 Tax=Segatella copri TaxID=165179 RepID=UPI003F6F7930